MVDTPKTPVVLVVGAFIQEVGDATLETTVLCGPDGLSVEHSIDGEPVAPETAGMATTALGKTYHRVVAAVDSDGDDYLFDGGWWAEDMVDGSCEPYEPPIWEDYLDGGLIAVTEVLWDQLALRDVACPYLQPDIRQAAIEDGYDGDLDTCTMDFDHLRRATVRDSKRDRHLLEIGFDCGPFGLDEVWYVIDGVFVANDYYHPPEYLEDEYEEFILEPMRDRYGDTVYDYRARAVEVDGEVFVFDVGRVRYDWNLEAALGSDNCDLVDWIGPPVAFEGATPGQLVWQTGWMVDAGLLGPECAGYSTCGKEIEYWEASGRDLGLMFWLTSEPTTAVVLDITWDPTEVSLGDLAGGCADTSQTETSETLRVTIEPDDWSHQDGMLTFATSGAGDGIADGDQVTEVRVTVVDELSDPAYHDADDLVMTVTTVDRPDGAICH
ncbi:MAG TPA: hypothetical protein DGF10_11280 [Acidimicrobiaceae bacterium]|nr:hypothetical protein [Acidimicrobiaceae bacterium]